MKTITYTAVDSTMIDLVGYDEKAKVLQVRLINSGLTYRYFDVPKKEFRGLMKADSIGRYMLDNIIDCYPYAKVRGGRRR